MPKGASREEKLVRLARDAGLSVDEMLRQVVFDSVSPGICMNPGCDYTTDVEPDQDQGWCEVCDTTTVMSASRLAGVI